LGYDAYFSPYKSNSRGVMVLFKNNFEQKVENVYSDENGNYLILDMLMPNFRLTLVNLYGPNDDKPAFYENIKKKYLKLVMIT
jgi:exonuclease III